MCSRRTTRVLTRALPQVGVGHKEFVASITVILLWLRQIRVLQTNSETGAFVFMLEKMVKNVLHWLIIYGFGAISFANGLRVLYRNERAAIGKPYTRVAIVEDCHELDTQACHGCNGCDGCNVGGLPRAGHAGILASPEWPAAPPAVWPSYHCHAAVVPPSRRVVLRVGPLLLMPRMPPPPLQFPNIFEAVLFLIEATLHAPGYWGCFRQSSAEAPGLALFIFFNVLVVIMLLNTLIAMMAETYMTVWGSSFKNYSFSFARLLHEARCTPGSTAVPFNLVSIPYQASRNGCNGCNGLTDVSVPYQASRSIAV